MASDPTHTHRSRAPLHSKFKLTHVIETYPPTIFLIFCFAFKIIRNFLSSRWCNTETPLERRESSEFKAPNDWLWVIRAPKSLFTSLSDWRLISTFVLLVYFRSWDCVWTAPGANSFARTWLTPSDTSGGESRTHTTPLTPWLVVCWMSSSAVAHY